jgi:phosphomannomutase
MPFIRSISGVRATLGDGLLPDVISRYATAFHSILPDGDIIIGRDGRPSGTWIEKIISGTLMACGRQVKLLGIVPTPTVQLYVEKKKSAGGIVITASHNPEQWNGVKFINKDGVFLDKDDNEKLFALADINNIEYSTNIEPSQEIEIFNAIDEHISSILSLPIFNKTDILEKLKARKYRIVVDAINSSGSVAIPLLLEKFGCEVIKLHCDNSGIFPHTPEPIPENLISLSDAVKEYKADLGIAVDPDADRLVFIDETGTPIGEERTIALAVETVLMNKKIFTKNSNLKVVVNYSTTRLVEDITAKYDAIVERSPVGEINVVKKMKEIGAIIGGEGSGGVILPACHYGRDSLVGTALILSLLIQKNKPLSIICSEMTQFSMVKTKKEFHGENNSLIDKIEKLFPDGKIVRDDGIKVEFENSWVQLRSSNTEPIIRIIAEALNNTQAQSLIDIVMQIVLN